MSAADRVVSPLRPLIVASWYPAVDDVAKGRFVADQVAALAATGQAQPAVVSFDPLTLVGGATGRIRQANAIEHRLDAALDADSLPFAAQAYAASAPAPIVRLAIGDGMIPGPGAASAEHHRSLALVALADRLLASGHPPSLVHAHTGYPDGAAAAAFARRLGCPLVITEHATFLDRILAHPIQRQRYLAGATAATRIIAVSQLLADQIATGLPEIADRVVVIPNLVAVDDFRVVAPAERDPDELLYVGYRTATKGIDTLLAAFALVRARHPSLRLRLVGRSTTPETEAVWQRMAAELGLGESVIFDGVTDRAGVVAAMSRAGLFVHASRVETFGVVVAEALAAGLPVVATDSGGVREILTPDPSAFGGFVRADDPAAFAAAIEATLARRMSLVPDDLRASIVERFSWTAVAGRLLRLYEGVLAEWPGAPPPAQTGNIAGRPDSETGDAPTPAAGTTAWPADIRARPVPIIVALDRRAAAGRVSVLPPGLRATLTVVTAKEPRDVLLGGIARLVELSVEPIPAATTTRRMAGKPWLDRLVRVAIDPIGAVRRRRADDPFAERPTNDLAAAVDEAVGPWSGAWLPIDGRDALVVAALEAIHATAASAPPIGGLRALADHWSTAPWTTGHGAIDGQPSSDRTSLR